MIKQKTDQVVDHAIWLGSEAKIAKWKGKEVRKRIIEIIEKPRRQSKGCNLVCNYKVKTTGNSKLKYPCKQDMLYSEILGEVIPSSS
jgi:hypothetical protein